MTKGSVKVVLEGEDELRRKLESIQNAMKTIVEPAIQAGADLVAADGNRRSNTDHVKTEVKGRKPDQVTIDIGPDKEHFYLQFQETGTVSHTEPIRGSKILAFEGEQGLVFTTKVQHPGVPARPFLRPAIDENQDRITQVTGEIFRKLIESFCE